MQKSHFTSLYALGISVVLEAFLRYWYGDSIPFLHWFLYASSTVVILCTLANDTGHWFSTLLLKWTEVFDAFGPFLAKFRAAGTNAFSEFLFWYYILLYEFVAGLLDPKSIPDRPCICGYTRLDGTRPTLREHCWSYRQIYGRLRNPILGRPAPQNKSKT